MMTFSILATYDSKAECFHTPFFLPNDAMGERVFRQMCQDPDHQFSLNPEDYTLFNIGTYNDQDGSIQSTPATAIINGIQATQGQENITEIAANA